MKLTETTQTIPAQTRTTTVYSCEHCDFKTTNAGDAQVHEGAHSFEEKRETPKNTFFRFSSQEQYKKFCSSDSGYTYGKWDGPGWYGFKLEDDYCMGCYMGQIQTLYPAAYFIDKCRAWIEEAQAISEITGIAIEED